MVNLVNNKAVVLLQRPTGYAVAGVHVGVKHKELDASLNDGDILVRNLYVSVDPCMSSKLGRSMRFYSWGLLTGQ